jgi:hypothetical protein
MVDIYVGPENTHWILHEKLLCSKSQFFNKIFYKGKNSSKSTSSTRAFGLPDEEDAPFRLFVGWLYSDRITLPNDESDLGDLFDLYLMGEKWQIAGLVREVLDAVRRFYRTTETYPGLRRVQYMYENTDEDSPMRQLLVSSVARMAVTGDGLPKHWERAMRKNGMLAVDVLRAIHDWKLDPDSLPDAREEAGDVEKKLVKGVEEAEAKQEGVPKTEQQQSKKKGDDEGSSTVAGSDGEQLAQGVQRLPNGVNAEPVD